MRTQALAQAGEATPTRLYLVRHGRVAEGHAHRYHGHNDIGLSPEGERQVEALARQLSRPCPVAAVYASDLKRSREGAARFCQGAGTRTPGGPRVPGDSFRRLGRAEL
jgi:broad specificity phosphatase PhoE